MARGQLSHARELPSFRFCQQLAPVRERMPSQRFEGLDGILDTDVPGNRGRTAPHSFGKGFVNSNWAEKGLDELQAAYVLGTTIEAGSETTSVQLNNTLVGILSRGQEVVKAAHEELDRVVGSSRTPTLDDEKNLPYIRAMVKEVNRWRFVNKFGTNHYATEDGWYKGYFIPKAPLS
jgi:Cytochrome P450